MISEELKNRIELLMADMKAHGIDGFNVFKGEEWDSATPEERFEAIEEVMRAAINGEGTEIDYTKEV